MGQLLKIFFSLDKIESYVFFEKYLRYLLSDLKIYSFHKKVKHCA